MDQTSLQVAETAVKTAPSLTTSVSPLSGLDLFTNVGMSFFFVLCLIFVLAWLVKRTGLNRYANGLINIKSSHAISTKERIIIVEVDERLLVVGVTPHQMTLLYTVDKEGTKAMLANESKVAPTTESALHSTFQQILKASFTRKK